MESISESELPEIDSAETEERFRTAEDGDSMRVYIRGGSAEYYAIDAVTITSVRHSRTTQDDVVWGQTAQGASVTMTLSWHPKEPNVGIPRPYPEGPITIDVENTTFEVYAIEMR